MRQEHKEKSTATLHSSFCLLLLCASWERNLITVLLVADETDRVWIARHCDIRRTGDDHTINNFERRHIENRGCKNIHRCATRKRGHYYEAARRLSGILRKIADHHELIAMNADGT